jgi:phenylpropionate dioxygenase-like ring-hydroxylating dioxygenase large terminal subunit
MYILLLCILLNEINGYGWVPLLDLKSYNTKIPSRIRVLDKEVVIWEKDKKVIVQDNACIHRKAPLSEGYIDKNTKNLCCSYHGWEYSSCGSVTHIPQLTKKKSSCYKIKTYDTKSHNNILWLNINGDEELPNHITEVTNVCDDTIVVELPYSMNILLENFFDPAHIPFAHHTLQSTRELASSVNSSLIKMNKDMIQFSFEDRTLRNKEYRNGSMTFYNPNHYELKSIFPDNLFIDSLQIYCVPIRNHKTRIFMQQGHKKSVEKEIYNLIPKFIKHALTMTFLDSDTFLLYSQQQELLRRNNFSNGSKCYTTPTSSDFSVIMFHKWLNKYNPLWFNYILNQTSVEMDRIEVFNRYESHTKNCKYCSETLENIKKIQISVGIISLVFSDSIQIILIGVVIYLLLEEMKTYFTYRNYIHNNLL